jgi:hypothetical protein
MRLRVSTDEAALGADQPAARLLDRVAGSEQIKPHHAAVETTLRPGSAPHPQLGHMLVRELGKGWYGTGRRMDRQFARGIFTAWPVVVACPHCSPILSPQTPG